MSFQTSRSAMLPIVAIALLLGACSDSGESSATSITPEPTAIVAPTIAPTTVLEPATTATPTPTPSPTVDPVSQQAQEVAENYHDVVLRILDNPRNVDVTGAGDLEAAGSPLEHYGLELVSSLLADNLYIGRDQTVFGLLSSEPLPDVDGVNVLFCVRSDGLWRDLDTDEIVRETASEPWVLTYELRRDEHGELKVWTFNEVDPEGELTPCEFSSET